MDNLSVISTLKRPEVELLLCCARTAPTDAHVERVRTLLQQPLHWEYILSVAKRNRVTVLLYKNLESILPDAVPVEILTRLQHAHQKTGVTNLRFARELVSILQLLTAHKISAIAYKGISLAHMLYQNLGLREFGDLDILVHEHEVVKAKALLLQHGFVQTWPGVVLSPSQEKTHIKQKYNYTLVRPYDRLVVELHWGITPRYLRIPPHHDSLWQRLTFMLLANQQVLVFAPEELLLILCVHGANHCWIRLNWICDIAELLRVYPAINWEYLFNLAEQWHVQRILLVGLSLAHSLLDATFPLVVQQRIAADPTASALAKQSYKWLFSEQWLHFTPFEEPLYHLRMRERWQERVHYCIHMLVPSAADSAVLPLPYPLSFLGYSLRSFRLLTKHGIKLAARK